MEKWVVVADDDVVTLKKTGAVLSGNGIHATAVKSGKALLEFLRSNTPDLILLDVLMPEMDGLETLRRLREKPGLTAGIPVIMMSADERQETRAACLRAGAIDYIPKPFDEEALLSKVCDILCQDRFAQAPLHREPEPGRKADMETVTALLEKQETPTGRVWMGRDALTNAYRYMLRFLERYQGIAFQVLFTVNLIREDASGEERGRIMNAFRETLQHLLRSSDIMFEIGDTQLFLLLPEAHDYDIDRIISRLLEAWHRSADSDKAVVTYEAREVRPDGRVKRPRQAEYNVTVVDDDPVNLKLAVRALDAEDFRVTALTSGEALLDYAAGHTPDLILLDILMPGMDGFEVMTRLRKIRKDQCGIPVILFTADDNREMEMKGLQLGATDFIRKPFLPEVLALRVRHVVELGRLQRDLTEEVDRKTKENESLSLRVVQSLARAIDAKDAYTNGHSSRVAEYARQIAGRCGYSIRRQNEIYLTGLLHDVGKIGVPDDIINKPGKLTPEEYEVIKTHPVIGEEILRSIRERPELAIGARWHHERYDGTGYPDGLAGNAIPEIARIIAVADAYDAMTSRRSYRDILPYEKVRSEMERGKGTQFDPVFAEVMMGIMEGK